MKRELTVLAILAILVLGPGRGALAEEGVTTLGVSAEFSSGKYGGTENTEILYVPVTAKYEGRPWTLRLVVPYISISGASNVVGADRVLIPGASGARRTDAGLGDIVASAFYNLLDERIAALGLDVGAKVKVGTADEARGLGTGEHDYAVQADVFRAFGALTAFGSLGYRWYGDPPGTELRDVHYGSVSASYRLSSQTSVGLAYDFRPAITSPGERISEATAFVSRRFSPDWKAQFYAVTGFAGGSPDFALGAVLNRSF